MSIQEGPLWADLLPQEGHPARSRGGSGVEQPAIEVRDLVKIYPGDVRALDGLSFAVEPGTIFGLLGPNGAGKSTTVKILTTLSRPDAGKARVAGLDVLREPDRVRHAILGVGFNLSLQPQDLPEELRSSATSLWMESGERVARPLACAQLLEHLEEWLSLHETEGFGPVADRWRELSSTLGRKVRITGDERPIEGDAVDLADDGALLVRTARGSLVRVVAGDVEHCQTL
jgi:hypothetical protein